MRSYARWKQWVANCKETGKMSKQLPLLLSVLNTLLIIWLLVSFESLSGVVDSLQSRW